MKGTYDNINYAFSLHRVYMGEEGERTGVFKVDYENCDGSTLESVSQTQKLQRDNRIGIRLCVSDGLTHSRLHLVTIKEEEIPELSDYTIEYVIASKIIEGYSQMPVAERKACLAFLERYVMDYEKVREFAQNPENFLGDIDPAIGISSQGTRRETPSENSGETPSGISRGKMKF